MDGRSFGEAGCGSRHRLAKARVLRKRGPGSGKTRNAGEASEGKRKDCSSTGEMFNLSITCPINIMEFLTTKVSGVYYIKPKIFRDNRGFFLESYSRKVFEEHGISNQFVQDNHSMSVKKGVLRGLHFQLPPHTQAKLIRVTKGCVVDVVVDLQKQSPTYGQWDSFVLSSDNFSMVYIPRGFAHGFCTLEENTEFVYKNDNFYAPQAESGIRWNDPSLAIPWPINDPILSEKDSVLPFLKDFDSPF
jgi:dTDP-4-dehydrorhamnose 3,5-epimerase